MSQHQSPSPPLTTISGGIPRKTEGMLTHAAPKGCKGFVQDSKASPATAHARTILHVPLVPQPRVDEMPCGKAPSQMSYSQSSSEGMSQAPHSFYSTTMAPLGTWSTLDIVLPHPCVHGRHPLPTALLASPSCVMSLSPSMSP